MFAPPPVVETGLPPFIGAPRRAPHFVPLRFQPVPVIGKQVPRRFLQIALASLGVEVSEFLVENVGALGTFGTELARRVVKAFGPDKGAVCFHLHRPLDAIRTELIQLLMQGLTLTVGGDLDHVEILAATATHIGNDASLFVLKREITPGLCPWKLATDIELVGFGDCDSFCGHGYAPSFT